MNYYNPIKYPLCWTWGPENSKRYNKILCFTAIRNEKKKGLDLFITLNPLILSPFLYFHTWSPHLYVFVSKTFCALFWIHCKENEIDMEWTEGKKGFVLWDGLKISIKNLSLLYPFLLFFFCSYWKWITDALSSSIDFKSQRGFNFFVILTWPWWLAVLCYSFNRLLCIWFAHLKEKESS